MTAWTECHASSASRLVGPADWLGQPVQTNVKMEPCSNTECIEGELCTFLHNFFEVTILRKKSGEFREVRKLSESKLLVGESAGPPWRPDFGGATRETKNIELHVPYAVSKSRLE